MKKGLVVFTMMILLFAPATAQQPPGFPTPSGNPSQLFFLQRTQNTNTVIYALNLKNGVPDSAKPVHIYWICYAEKSQQEELTGIQRKYAYGLSAKAVGNNQFELTFLANKKYTLVLKKGADHQFHVYAIINGQSAILTKIYLQIQGGSLFSPNIEYVILTGTDPQTGKIVTEQKKI